jgi:hypothetical protein
MITPGTFRTRPPGSDLYNRQQAQLRDLADMQNDLLEALEGLTWQQDRKKAELAMAEEAFREIAQQREESLHLIRSSISTARRISHNQTMAEASLAQLHISTLQKQVEYLEKQIAGTRRKLMEIRDEIAQQRNVMLSR